MALILTPSQPSTYTPHERSIMAAFASGLQRQVLLILVDTGGTPTSLPLQVDDEIADVLDSMREW